MNYKDYLKSIRIKTKSVHKKSKLLSFFENLADNCDDSINNVD